MPQSNRFGRKKAPPGRSPEEDRETYVPPNAELGTSDEIVLQGRQDYATERVPAWPQPDSARQYVATPEGKQEIQHGVVTWTGAAGASPEKDDVELRDEPGHRRTRSKPEDLEL